MNRLHLNSSHQIYPHGMVLEVFWGVFEGYTGLMVLVEAFGRSLFSGLLSRHQPDQVPMRPGEGPPPGLFAPGCVLAL